MLFKPGLIEQILANRKTQTRRVLKPGEHWGFSTLPSIAGYYVQDTNKRRKWRVGQDYAVCPGRGKHQVARILITDIHAESLIDITEGDAILEGFECRADFIAAWDTINPKAPFSSNPAVWVIDFRLKAS